MALLLWRRAVEFRDKSWCQKEVYDILKKYNVAWVIADFSKYLKTEIVTADFVYIRMHGGKILYSSNYSKEELRKLAKKIKEYLNQNLDVFCYFNNDAKGYALKNANTLMSFLKKE